MFVCLLWAALIFSFLNFRVCRHFNTMITQELELNSDTCTSWHKVRWIFLDLTVSHSWWSWSSNYNKFGQPFGESTYCLEADKFVFIKQLRKTFVWEDYFQLSVSLYQTPQRVRVEIKAVMMVVVVVFNSNLMNERSNLVKGVQAAR